MSSLQIILLITGTLVVWVAGTAAFAMSAARRHPPIGRFTECYGVRLHYVERGGEHQRVIVFLHGNGMTVHDFVISGLLDYAAARYRVLCFDRPGFGHSTRPRFRMWTPEKEAELFAAVLQRLGIGQAVVLGHSWGTLVALAMSLRFPQFVQGLVLASGYYFPTWRGDVLLASGPAVPIIGDLMRYTISPILAWALFPKLMQKLFAPRPVPDPFSRQFPVALAVRPLHLRAAAEEAALMIPAAARLQRQYSELRCPVALIVGDKDEIVNREQTMRLQRLLKRSIMRSVPDAGHMVHHATPDRVMDAASLIFASLPVDQPKVAVAGRS
jgi:pimeloyl-ACP methyl ester carboxylesterase